MKDFIIYRPITIKPLAAAVAGVNLDTVNAIARRKRLEKLLRKRVQEDTESIMQQVFKAGARPGRTTLTFKHLAEMSRSFRQANPELQNFKPPEPEWSMFDYIDDAPTLQERNRRKMMLFKDLYSFRVDQESILKVPSC